MQSINAASYSPPPPNVSGGIIPMMVAESNFAMDDYPLMSRVAASDQSTAGVQASRQSTPGVLASHQSTPGVSASHQSTSGVLVARQSTPGVVASPQFTPGVPASHQSTSGVPTAPQISSSFIDAQSLPMLLSRGYRLERTADNKFYLICDPQQQQQQDKYSSGSSCDGAVEELRVRS